MIIVGTVVQVNSVVHECLVYITSDQVSYQSGKTFPIHLPSGHDNNLIIIQSNSTIFCFWMNWQTLDVFFQKDHLLKKHVQIVMKITLFTVVYIYIQKYSYTYTSPKNILLIQPLQVANIFHLFQWSRFEFVQNIVFILCLVTLVTTFQKCSSWQLLVNY